MKIAQATLTYKIPDQVTLTGTEDYDLGMIESKGTLGAIIDPRNNVFGGLIHSDVIIHVSKLGLSSVLPANVLDGGDITLPSEAIAINNSGFGVYIPPPGAFGFFGTIAYHWGDPAPVPYPFQDVTGRFTTGIPQPAADGRRGHTAAGAAFGVPAGTPTASLTVSGAGGAPAVVLVAPGGRTINPASRIGGGATVVALGDRSQNATYIGMPPSRRWSLAGASRHPAARSRSPG